MTMTEVTMVGGPLDGEIGDLPAEPMRLAFFVHPDGDADGLDTPWYGYYWDRQERDEAGRPVFRTPRTIRP